MGVPYKYYELCNEYTSVIPNLTEDFSSQFKGLMHAWSGIPQKRVADYGEKGMRDSNWMPPEGYSFTRFIEDGINLEVLQPKNVQNDNVILTIHGGSFIYRMADGFSGLMPVYAKAGHQATVVGVDYRVTPEYTHLDMIQDVVTAYEWLLKKGYKPSNIIMAGDSSGGCTALGAMLYMRDHGYELPAGIITISAVTNMLCNTESWSYNDNVDLCFGGNNNLQSCIEKFVGDNDYTDPYISPYFGDYHDFPSMLIQVGGAETLLEENRHIADMAYELGIDVKFEIYENMFHDFQCMNGSLIEADIALQNIQQFMDKVFESRIAAEDSDNLPVAL